MDYKYDAAGQLSQAIALNTQDNKELFRVRYTWDNNNNMVQSSYVTVEFDTMGQRLVKDSIKGTTFAIQTEEGIYAIAYITSILGSYGSTGSTIKLILKVQP